MTVTGNNTVNANIVTDDTEQHGVIVANNILNADVFTGTSVTQFPGITSITFDTDEHTFDETTITWDS